MSRHLRLIAAVAVVLVALSGFSPARKGGSRSSGKSGGCSSSSSSSHSSSGSSGSSYGSASKDRYDSDSGSYSGSRRYNSTTGTTGSRNGSASNGSPTGTVTQCAARSGSEAKAVVEVRNPTRYTKTYDVKVKFLDSSGSYVDSGEAEVEVGSRGTDVVDVRMAHPNRIGDVSECLVESVR